MLAVVVAAGGLIWWGARDGALHSTSAAPQARGDVGSMAVGPGVEQGKGSAVQARAGARDSLRGTQVDGAVHLDAKGRPIADRELRRLFDYFLSRIGERNEQQIRADLDAYLSAKYAAAAIAQVLVWFDSYVTLQRSSVSLTGEAGDPRTAVARLRALRAQRMGPQIAEAWWGDEDRYLDYTLARQDLLADASLSVQERERRLAELDGSLDPARLALRKQDDQAEHVMAQNEDYAQRQVPAEQRYAEREREYGDAAAQRLAELDQKRAQWDGRLREFAVARQGILGDTRLSAVQRESQLSELLARRFDSNERLRVDAMARNGLLPK